MNIKNIAISKRRFILISLIPLQMIIFSFLIHYPSRIETIYSQGLYKGIVFLLRVVFGWIPLPIAQVLLFIIIVLPVWWIIRQIVKIRRKQIRTSFFLWNGFTLSLAIFSVVYFLFMTLWGFNYHRKPLYETVELDPGNIKNVELKAVCEKLIELTNKSRMAISMDDAVPLNLKLTHKQMISMARDGYKTIALNQKIYHYQIPSVKAVYLPQLMSMYGVSGIYIPFTGEAIVNLDPPSYLNPSTICHEMAHQLGFAPEDEANYISFLACRAHPDPAFQYSGYLMAMRYAMNALGRTDRKSFDELKVKFSKGVNKDLEASRAYWNRFYNPINVFSSFFYDYFLKANGQKAGIYSYNLMVRLLVGDYRKNNHWD